MALMSAFTSGSVPEHGEESHTDSGVTAGLYSWPVTFTVNAAGHLTQAARSYDNTLTYAAHALVIGSDSNIYRATTSTVGNNPVTDSGSNWALYLATGNISLSVAAAGRFATPWAAYDFIKSAIIPDGTVVTISLAAETYTKTTAWYVNHPFGNNIKIVGPSSATTKLLFSSHTDGIQVGWDTTVSTARQPGGRLYIEGVEIEGTWDYTGAGGSGDNGYNKIGIAAWGTGACVTCNDVLVDKFYFGFHASRGGTIFADGCDVTGCGDSGFIALHSGHIQCKDSTVVNAKADGVSLGHGYTVENNGSMEVGGASATGCRNAGFIVANSGAMIARTAITSSNNVASTGSGAEVREGGSLLLAAGGTFSSNGAQGIYVKGGDFRTASTTTCSSNTGTGIMAEGGIVRIDGATTCNSNGVDGIRALHGATVLYNANVTCNSNTLNGVRLQFGAGMYRNSGTLTCHSNTDDGVELDNAIATIRSCAVGVNGQANGGFGIHAQNLSKVDASGGTITYNTSFGVTATNMSQVIVTGANVNNNNGAGVQYSPNTEDAFGTNGVYIRTL